jgi:precorrin-3B synthase
MSVPLRSIRRVPHPIRRSETDACPGALRLHAAADGPLARIRLPGGRLTGAQLAALTALAVDLGDGGLELTSRANVQLRALTRADSAELAAGLSAAGLLPAPSHETVRNIAAPPLADTQTRTLVRDLDAALCADPGLAALPGRFLFAIGAVPLAADVAALPTGSPAIPASGPAIPTGGPALPTGEASGRSRSTGGLAVGEAGEAADSRDDGEFAVLFAGQDEGLRVPAGRVVAALLAAAHAFLRARAEHRAAGATANTADTGTRGQRLAEPGKPAWRLAELPGGARPVAERTATELGIPLREAPALGAGVPASPIGVVRQPDGRVAVGAIVPLGRLTGVQLTVLAEADQLVVTPWRGLVVADLPPAAAPDWERRLTEAGLPTAPESRWTGVTACAGRPGCAKSLADVRADALATTRFVDGLPVHWLGCARGCGSPAGAHVRVEATGNGYTVTTPTDGKIIVNPPTAAGLATVIAAARRS